MTTSKFILNTIDKLPKGYIFTSDDFMNELNGKEAVIKALNRLAASGKITKLSKGKYYKPEQTPFGSLEPDRYQVVKDLLESNGKTVGYLTGFSIYNQLGLTTQVSNTIELGKNEVRPKFKRGRYSITCIRQKNTITKENIPLLQLLDAIRYIKKIPDTTPASSCRRFIAILKNLSEKDLTTMARLAKKYPPATRALLGALLETTGSGTNLTLLNSLNPITKYTLKGVADVLPNAEKWNIV